MLAVFDFDHTIVNANSDIVARDMINPPSLIPDLKDYPNNWIRYMQQVFNTINNMKIPAEEVIDTISSMKPAEGIPKLMRAIYNNNFDIIVVSDSNSLFIENWLKRNKLLNIVSYVYTNKATIENGLIKIKPYTRQTTCDLCTKNMCKGIIVEEHIMGPTKKYDKVLYFGDGKNDLCPVLKLGNNDIVFPRMDFGLWNLLKADNISLRASVIPWCAGDNIYEYLKSFKLIPDICN